MQNVAQRPREVFFRPDDGGYLHSVLASREAMSAVPEICGGMGRAFPAPSANQVGKLCRFGFRPQASKVSARTRRRQSDAPIEIVPWCRFCPRSGASNEWRQINETTSDEEGGQYKMWCDESLSATFLPVNAYDDVGAKILGAQSWQFKL